MKNPKQIRPTHYNQKSPYEAVKIITAWGLDFNTGNTLKYLSRMGKKDGESRSKDFAKAETYVHLQIETPVELRLFHGVSFYQTERWQSDYSPRTVALEFLKDDQTGISLADMTQLLELLYHNKLNELAEKMCNMMYGYFPPSEETGDW